MAIPSQNQDLGTCPLLHTVVTVTWARILPLRVVIVKFQQANSPYFAMKNP